jgi:hypothetical protein
MASYRYPHFNHNDVGQIYSIKIDLARDVPLFVSTYLKPSRVDLDSRPTIVVSDQDFPIIPSTGNERSEIHIWSKC